MLPLAPSAIVIEPESVPEFVLRIRSPAPLEVIVALAPLSPTLTVSAFKRTSPVPFGSIVILAFAPSAIVIEPELEPEFVLSIKSPVPSVVIVALAFESPILTVSAESTTSPVPLGVKVILPLEVDTIELPLTSKFPPSCGVVSVIRSKLNLRN
jgi:hypothetical protein